VSEAPVHRYRATARWAGSTAVGYDRYDRDHDVACPPAGDLLALSSDAAFGGDPTRLSPEQLLVAAAASCQLLSFLAVAARARVDVTDYRDEAEADMPEDDLPVRITAIRLRPVITVRGDVDDDRLGRLVEMAHRTCYIASSLRTEVSVEPTFLRAEERGEGSMESERG
jgi:organic hydroperoxide reductase OsmC/OhrA